MMGMEPIESSLGWIRFRSCLDQREGLVSLPDQSIDLVITDPPWGEEYDGSKVGGRPSTKAKSHKERIIYNDAFDIKKMERYLTEIKRISKICMIVLGWNTYYEWLKHFENPTGTMIIAYNNGTSESKTSRFQATLPVWCHVSDLEYTKTHKTFRNYFSIKNASFETYILNGFLRIPELRHSSPKNSEPFIRMVNEIKPMTICDPFAGSGWIAEIAHATNTRYCGWELLEECKHDIEIRIKRGKKMWMNKCKSNLLTFVKEPNSIKRTK